MRHLTAAFIFFTRLPLWKWKIFYTPPDSFREVIHYWALTGWLTAGVMSGTLWLSAYLFPYPVAVLLALLSRLLLTGALHEDGLADFLDGFGGGRDKEKILAIMKDSHIGTYGVIGLIFYFLLLYLLLVSLPLPTACIMILIADPLCKWIASQIVRFLPYARTAEASKAKIVYSKGAAASFILSGMFGLLPLLLLPGTPYLPAVFLPLVTFFCLIHRMKTGIGGYTGDCCGALFLLCELSFYTGIAICFKLLGL
ncbi:MAG: adenosylcobinamide-GDP ribazoletransferase [Culturomica sp.]|jgi:adenosylcobinamide-GDP ribazoletransferase|nr:adenosylcobinamide-GDP ribazoletransferase [Culturomica sp.]